MNKILFKQILAGLLTQIPPFRDYLLRKYYQNTGGTANAEYCLVVWAKHLDKLLRKGWKQEGSTVYELGPGDSLGVGIMAVLSGVSSYKAVDVLSYNVIANTQRVLQQFRELLQSGKPVPDNKKVKPVFETTQEVIENLLAGMRRDEGIEEKFEKIAEDLEHLFDPGYHPHYIRYVPLNDYLSSEEPESIDLIFSQSMLEYVDDVPQAVRLMRRYLRSGGWISHEVDLGSMRTSAKWDGHWAYPDWLWKVMRGKRPFFINRNTAIDYRNLMDPKLWSDTEFHPFRKKPETVKRKLAPRFRKLDEETLSTSSIYFIARKTGP